MSCGCGSTYTLTPGDRLYLSAMVKALQQRVSALEGGGIGADLDVFITQKLQTILPSWTLQPLPPKETDPTIPLWAKQSTKPSYTAAEVGATTPDYVNQTATIVANNAASALDSHVTRVDNPHNVTAAQLGAAAIADLSAVAFSGNFYDLEIKPVIPVPVPQVNADWNATSGVEQILSKPQSLADLDSAAATKLAGIEDNAQANVYQTVVEYSDTAPTDPGVKFWFKTDTGVLYTRYGSVWASIDTVTV